MAKQANLPMNSHVHLIDDQYGAVESRSYRPLIDKLLCLTLIRPDISFTVERLGQFIEKPRQVYWEAAVMVFRYVKSSLGNDLQFRKGSPKELEAYNDADSIGSLEIEVHYRFLHICWRESCILSQQEADCGSQVYCKVRVLSHGSAIVEMMWIWCMLSTLGVEITLPKMYYDNGTTIRIGFHERSKNIEVDCT